MSKAVLVTGGAGYIGAHVAKALAASGYLPVTIDNFAYGHRAAVRWGPLVEGDIGDGDLVARTLAAHNVVAAVHLAGYAYVGESVTDPLKYFDNNVARSITLLAALRHAGARAVVFSSSCAVYGEPVRVPIDEDHPYAPVNPYGQSKLMFERILEATGRAHGLKWLALRYFNAAGADPDGELGEDHNPETHLIPLAIFAAQGKGPALQVLGTDYDTPDGTAIRDYVHVTDLAEAHVKAIEDLLKGGAGGALNLGTGRGHSVLEVIGAVERALGKPVPRRNAPRRPGDTAVLVARPDLARRRLGWRPRFTSIDEIVRTACAWYTRPAQR